MATLCSSRAPQDLLRSKERHASWLTGQIDLSVIGPLQE